MASKVGNIVSATKEPKLSSREILLKAAGELMTERSTVDISLSDIARYSGLNSAMVKYYFGDKQGMMLALAEDVIGRSLIRMNELVVMDVSATEKLKLHIQAIITIYFRYPFINQLIHHLSTDPETSKVVAEKISRPLVEAQRILLEQGLKADEFKPVDPMMFYFIILGACDHLFFGRHIMKLAFGVDTIDDAIRREYTRTLLDMVFGGILKT